MKILTRQMLADHSSNSSSILQKEATTDTAEKPLIGVLHKGSESNKMAASRLG